MKFLVLAVLISTLFFTGCAENTPAEPTQSPQVSAGTETPAPTDLTPTPASPNEDVGAVDAEHDSHEGHDH